MSEPRAKTSIPWPRPAYTRCPDCYRRRVVDMDGRDGQGLRCCFRYRHLDCGFVVWHDSYDPRDIEQQARWEAVNADPPRDPGPPPRLAFAAYDDERATWPPASWKGLPHRPWPIRRDGVPT